jgi:hypothetical protein
MHIQLLSIIQLVKTVTRFTQYNTFETAQFYPGKSISTTL